MNFPCSHCVPTKYLNKPMYDLLLTKLITEGYHWPSNFDKSCFFDLWEYIGVNTYGDIHLFSEAKSFLGVEEEPQNNVLSEYWVREYLR